VGELDFTHRFIPSAQEPTQRVLLLLHGTGGNEDDLIPLGRTLDPNAALLSPRGKILENGMPRFFRRLAEGVFDEEDVIRRAHQLADFVGEAARFYKFDPKRLVAIGYSNGANIAAAILLLRPEVLSAAILLRAMVPLVPEPLPNLADRKILISSGENDPIIAAENVQQLVRMLKKAGANVTLHIEPAGHALTRGDISVAEDWLENLDSSERS